MNGVLLGVSLALGVGKNLISKAGGPKFSNINFLLRNNIITAILALIVFGSSKLNFSFILNYKGIFISALLGIFIMLSQIFYICALKREKVSVCSLIYSCGFIIPTFLGVFFYNEDITKLNLVGVCLILLSVYLVSGVKINDISGSLMLSIGAMISSGMVGVLQKIYIKTVGTSIDEGLFIAFLVMFILSLFIKLFVKNTQGESGSNRRMKLLLVLFALCVVATNKMNLFLSGKFSSAVFFPIVNGGCVTLTVLLARYFFNERLTRQQVFGIAINVVSIILISI